MDSFLADGKSINSGLGHHEHLLVVADIATAVERLRSLSYLRIQYIMFDEADEMFNDELHDDSASILQSCLGDAKTMFFSATFPPHIVTRIEEALAQADPEREAVPYHVKLCVSTSINPSINAVVPHVRKYFSVIPESQIIDSAVQLIQESLVGGHLKIVIFGGSKKLAHSISAILVDRKVDCCVMQSPLDEYLNKTVVLDPQGFLFRGVNIPGLDCGISVGIPEQKETLLHQWGRIAREGQEGFFYHIVSPDEVDQLNCLSFQLGIDFEQYHINESICLHPFEIHASIEDRMQHILHLIERVS